LNKRALGPEDIYNIRTLGKAELSSDGKYLAYLVQSIDGKKDKPCTDIFLTCTDTRQTRRLTSSGDINSVSFSPQGQHLAFTSRRSGKEQIWIMSMQGGEAWQLPTPQAVKTFQWDPNGRRIFYSAKVFSKPRNWSPYPGAPVGDGQRLEKLAKQNQTDGNEEPKNKARVITSFKYRADGTGYLGDMRSHIFEIPVPQQPPLQPVQAQSRQITQGDWDYTDFSPSPDGKYFVAAGSHSSKPELAGKSDLWLYEVDTGHCHQLYAAPGPSFSPSWSPQGKHIAFRGHDLSCGRSTTAHLWLLDVDQFFSQDKQPLGPQDLIPVTQPLDRPAGAYAGAELRLAGGKTMFWSGEELYFLMTDRGVPGIYKTDCTGKVSPVLVDKERAITSIHGIGDTLAYTASAPDQLEELYINIGGQERQIPSLNKEFLEGIEMGRWEHMPYQSDDGQGVDGWVIYPTNYQPGQKYPLLLLIHGGPHGAYGPAFMYIGQQFAGRGYLVLYTNPRGSESYGQEFACCIDKNWGDRDYADIMAGVDALVAKGIVHEDNIFAHGWSYGGYMSCWLATQTDKFKAICAGASVTNLLSDYGTSDITMSDEWEYGGQPWRDAEHLLRHSPLNHVENVTTPLLLLHGEKDMRCPASQTEEFYIALQRLGKEAVMVRYPDEFHSLRRPHHRVDRYQRLLAWFEHHRS